MANYIAETLRAGGVPAEDIVLLPLEETAAMLVRVRGRDPAARPILFSGHMDVVDARPEDWERSPFTLVEENGFFFGRGVGDNKTGITSMVSTILRMRADRRQPRRTLVFAFIGDEETTFDTTRLVAAHEWARNAEYAINTDAGGGMLAPDGRPLVYLVQGAEKTFASFRLTLTNPGGHSSRPRDDNAIYDLSRAQLRIATGESSRRKSVAIDEAVCGAFTRGLSSAGQVPASTSSASFAIISIASTKRSISARSSDSVGSTMSVPATGKDMVGAWKP